MKKNCCDERILMDHESCEETGRLISEINEVILITDELELKFTEFVNKLNPVCNSGKPALSKESENEKEKEEISPLSKIIKDMRFKLVLLYERMNDTIDRIEL